MSRAHHAARALRTPWQRCTGWPISVAVHLVTVTLLAGLVSITERAAEAPLPVLTIGVAPAHPPTASTETCVIDRSAEQLLPSVAALASAAGANAVAEPEAQAEQHGDGAADPAAAALQGFLDLGEASQAHETGDEGIRSGSGQVGHLEGTSGPMVGEGWRSVVRCCCGSTHCYFTHRPASRRYLVLREGGSVGSEEAVAAALRWFKRHQSGDGRWSAVGYAENCVAGPRCEPGSLAAVGGSEADIALTGYAVLCYLGAGCDHQVAGPYRSTVRRGLDHLLAAQQADGLLGVRTYEHAIATYALAEAYLRSNDPALRAPAQRAIAVILHRQARDGGSADARLGWDYVAGRAERNDTSVGGWCVLALRAAAAAGLEVGTGLDGARRWVEGAWRAANPSWAQRDGGAACSGFPYVWDAASGAVQVAAPGSAVHDLAAAGALCAAYLGARAGDPVFESLCDHIAAYQLPAAYPCNTYYLYYGTTALFQGGGARWQRWNAVVRHLLVGAQRGGDGCFAGSWDAQGTVFPGHDVGRVLSTAYCCLCLEVYYRAERVVVGAEAARAGAL